MLVNITAIWNRDMRDFGTTAAFYEVPDDYGNENSVLGLFGRIARDFAAETDDPYALEQIELGFDWGAFLDVVGGEFLSRYGVKRVEFPECLAIDVEYDEHVTAYR